MAAHKTDNLPKSSGKSAGSPSICFDATEFLQYVDDTDWSENEKAEYITLVWNIVCEFVAMGWGVHPTQQAKESCGQTPKKGSIGPVNDTDMVDSHHGELIEEFMRRNEELSRSGGERVTDE